MSKFSQPKIDCHCHVIDPARFPYDPGTPYRPSGQEIAPVDHFMRMMDIHEVRHALLVGTNSGYGEDLGPVLDAIDRGEGRFKGIGVVANDAAAADLARLKSRGIAGVAFNATFHSPGYYAGAGELLRKLADLDMFLQVQVEADQLVELLPLIEGSSVRLLIDHCGRPRPDRGLGQPGFEALLELGRSGRASVKLSGFNKFSGERYPYDDVHPFVQSLIEAFGLDRCLWGSDWPFLRAAERIDYGPLLHLVESMVPTEAGRTKLLWETPSRLFGFGPTAASSAGAGAAPLPGP
jgi:predicted TIM-barrel fold metal-dependent hydrolase